MPLVLASYDMITGLCKACLLVSSLNAGDRIAALTTERMSWEDWKKKQKEDLSAAKKLADAEEEKMREYREQLDADRAARLSKGTNNTHLRAQVSL